MIKLKNIIKESESLSGDAVVDNFVSLLPKYGLEFHSWHTGDKNVALNWRGNVYPTVTDKDRLVKIALDRSDIYGYEGNVYVGSSAHPLVHGYVIQAIVTDPNHRNKGKAKEMMKKVLLCADESGLLLKLEPVPMKDFIKKGQESLNIKQLQKWYGKLGFKKDPNANLMTRHPSKLSEDEVKKEKEAFRLEREGKLKIRTSDIINTTNGSGVDIRIYNTDDLVHNIGGICILFSAPVQELGGHFPKPGYLFVDFIQVEKEKEGEGYGFLLYKAALIFAQKNHRKGLCSSKLHRTSKAKNVWDRLKTTEDKYYDYVDIKDLGTRIKEQLSESKSLNTKDGVADYLIRKAWRYMDKDDKYDSYQLFLYIDNDESLSMEAWKLSAQFYPQSDEPWYEFQEDVKEYLYKLEKRGLNIRKAKTKQLENPLNVLRGIIKGKSWESAKMAIWNQLTTSRTERTSVSDEDAERVFNRLYKNAMGETVYNKEEIDKYGYGRLSQLMFNPIDSSSEDRKQYMINVFIRHYGDKNKIPDRVKVWRGTNSPHSSIRPGDFVTFDRGYAEGYQAGKWKAIVTDILDSKDLLLYKADPGTSELVYWPEGHQIKKYEGDIPTLKQFWKELNFGYYSGSTS